MSFFLMVLLKIPLCPLALTKESTAVSVVCFSIKYRCFTVNKVYIFGSQDTFCRWPLGYLMSFLEQMVKNRYWSPILYTVLTQLFISCFSGVFLVHCFADDDMLVYKHSTGNKLDLIKEQY